ncbi:MAG: outer membrane lipoprotein LolB [Steroidobacteraceae bacterium]
MERAARAAAAARGLRSARPGRGGRGGGGLHGRPALEPAWRERPDPPRWSLGIGGLDIESGPGSTLRLTTGRGERLDGEAARSEVERRLGFALPIEALRYWLQGVPAPGGSAEERRAADAARLAGLEQQGWRVDYGDYVESGQGPLPRRLTAVRSGARVRLVIEAWELRR